MKEQLPPSLCDKIQPLVGDRKKGESDNAVIACNDWLRMGTGRTLVDLHYRYTSNHQDAPPTQSADTLKRWSSKFKWSDRATEYDSNYEALKNAERKAVLDYGAALDFDRVARLKRLADLLETQIFERSVDDEGAATFHNVWIPDVKQIGGGDNAERVDIRKFNGALISEYRSVLDDIAKEVGGRIKKSDVTSNGESININADAIIESLLKARGDLDG